MSDKVKLSKDGSSIDFVQSESIPTSLKKFRQSPEIEGFYRFIYENDLQKEAYEILERIIASRKAKKAAEKAAAKEASRAAKEAEKAKTLVVKPAKEATKVAKVAEKASGNGKSGSKPVKVDLKTAAAATRKTAKPEPKASKAPAKTAKGKAKPAAKGKKR